VDEEFLKKAHEKLSQRVLIVKDKIANYETSLNEALEKVQYMQKQ